MKPIEQVAVLVRAMLLVTGLVLRAEVHRSEWRQTQRLEVATPGLIKIPVPLETLGVLRSEAADLRLLDPVGGEVGWYLERPLQFVAESAIQPAKSSKVTLGRRSTELLLETGTTLPIAGLTLETGTGSFLKAVRVEGSRDGSEWEAIADRLPVYQNYQGETRRELVLPARSWTWMRVTVDDSRSDPVLLTGARLHRVTQTARTGVEKRVARIVSREELPGESRLTLDLGTAHLDVVAIEVMSPDGVFTRPASIRSRDLEKNAWVERTMARGLLYRELGGAVGATPTRLEVGAASPSREVVLVIQNGDNPPLKIQSVAMEVMPVQLVFWARQAGRFEMLVENPLCAAPRYDLGAFAEQIKTAEPGTAVLGPLMANPDYQPPAVLPLPFALGAALEVAEWRFRKKLPVTRDGAQQIELDPAVVAGARPDLGDLRLVSEGRQRPFVVEPMAGLRFVPLQVTSADEPSRPAFSRWKLALPRVGFPMHSIEVKSTSDLFERDVTLFEDEVDSRGIVGRRILGEGHWQRTPGEAVASLLMKVRARPNGGVVWMEIRNGDNAPILVSEVRASYPVTRIRFLAPVAPATWLYYGNPQATPPDYDLRMVASRLMVADSAVVVPGDEEGLGGGVWRERVFSEGGRWLFWAALGCVVVGLLWIMRRLVPASDPSAGTPQ